MYLLQLHTCGMCSVQWHFQYIVNENIKNDTIFSRASILSYDVASDGVKTLYKIKALQALEAWVSEQSSTPNKFS